MKAGSVIQLRPLDGYRMAVEFPPDAGPEYVDGFEAGLLLARLDARPVEWSGTYHARNREQLARIASGMGYAAAWEPSSDETWLFATFSRGAHEG